MQQQDRVAKLVEWFMLASRRHAEAIEALHEEAAAVQVERLNRFFRTLHQEEGGMTLFFGLLEHVEPAVAGMAAVYALREAPERCLPVLARLADTPGMIGFRAQIALERWKSGDWPEEE